MNWARVTRSMQIGGLGIYNLETLSWALRMRWLWLQKQDPTRWTYDQFAIPTNVRAMFDATIKTVVGDGNSTVFWTDRWLHGRSILELAPALSPFIRKLGWRKLTVRQGMDNNQWTKFIIGGLDVVAVWQYVQLWQLINTITLSSRTADKHIWMATSSGMFTSKSAYELLHNPHVIGGTNA